MKKTDSTEYIDLAKLSILEESELDSPDFELIAAYLEQDDPSPSLVRQFQEEISQNRHSYELFVEWMEDFGKTLPPDIDPSSITKPIETGRAFPSSSPPSTTYSKTLLVAGLFFGVGASLIAVNRQARVNTLASLYSKQSQELLTQQEQVMDLMETQEEMATLLNKNLESQKLQLAKESQDRFVPLVGRVSDQFITLALNKTSGIRGPSDPSLVDANQLLFNEFEFDIDFLNRFSTRHPETDPQLTTNSNIERVSALLMTGKLEEADKLLSAIEKTTNDSRLSKHEVMHARANWHILKSENSTSEFAAEHRLQAIQLLEEVGIAGYSQAWLTLARLYKLREDEYTEQMQEAAHRYLESSHQDEINKQVREAFGI